VWVLALALVAAPVAASGPDIAQAAERQVGVTVTYDGAYRRLSHPGGDVPLDRGVCSDVVVRSLRAIGVDLQAEVHRDMKRNFRRYPDHWGLRAPDANIDHRRVPNLMVFFARQGAALPLHDPYLPGDIVAWRLANGLHHIGVVASQRAASGNPLVVHNIGQGAQLEDVLDAFKKIGHYRWAAAEEHHALFAELQPPYAASRAALRKMLAAEGYDAQAEGSREVVLALTAGQIHKLFQARITLRKVEASSRRGLIEQPFLEPAAIPPRFAKNIRRVYLDPQRG
jgi:uncharacterized protein YijF (DUF1287 family)